MASHVATDGGAPELKSGQDGHMSTSVDKGLKMKIKRKSVHSGQRHEIVAEDDGNPKAKKIAKEEKQGGGGGILGGSLQQRLNGTNGQILSQLQQPHQSLQQLQLHQQQLQQQQQQQNGPPISAPETVIRNRPTEPVLNRDQGTICSSVGIVTEPDSLGVCEPGTSVLLEGIVWQETEGGVLVVNVTWRGKTYVGTLLDATRHDWAPPRLTEDNDERNRSLGFGGRAKRSGQTRTLSGSEDNSLSKLRNGKGRRSFTPVPASPGKCASPVAADSPKVKKPMSEQQSNAKDTSSGDKLADEKATGSSSSSSEGGGNGKASATAASGKVTRVMAEDEDAIEEANMLDCPEPSCHKRFKQLNGLRYHQTHAHNDRTPPPPPKEGGDDQVAVNANEQNDSCSNDIAAEKLEQKIKKDESNPKNKESTGKTSAVCDRNTPNSNPVLLNADSNGSTSNGPSPEDNDTLNMAQSSTDLENDVTGGAHSPAYSDISDDNNPQNGNSSTNGDSPTSSSTTANPTAAATTTTTSSTVSAVKSSAPTNQSNGELRTGSSGGSEKRSDTSGQQQTNSRPSSAGSVNTSTAMKSSSQSSSCTTVAGSPIDDRKDLSSLNKLSPTLGPSPSPLAAMGGPLGLGSPVGLSSLMGHGQSPGMPKSSLSQPSLFPSFPSGLKLGQSIPSPQMGLPPQLMGMPHPGLSPQPSPRGKATPPSQERLTPKNSSSQQPPNQFMPQIGGESLNFSQSAHKRMSPSMDHRRDSGGPSPKPMPQGLSGPFGGPPPNMFLGGNPFGPPFQSPFSLEAAMYHHQNYLDRFGAAPVPGAAPPPGKAALDLLQQVSRR